MQKGRIITCRAAAAIAETKWRLSVCSYKSLPCKMCNRMNCLPAQHTLYNCCCCSCLHQRMTTFMSSRLPDQQQPAQSLVYHSNRMRMHGGRSEQKPHYKGQSVIQQQRAYKECSQYVVSVEGKLKTGRKMQGNWMQCREKKTQRLNESMQWPVMHNGLGWLAGC